MGLSFGLLGKFRWQKQYFESGIIDADICIGLLYFIGLRQFYHAFYLYMDILVQVESESFFNPKENS